MALQLYPRLPTDLVGEETGYPRVGLTTHELQEAEIGNVASWSSRTDRWRLLVGIALGTVLLVWVFAVPDAGAKGRAGQGCTAGAPGIGDAYYPTYGNGGYDVRHYDLHVAYDPATDNLDGKAKIRAEAAQSTAQRDRRRGLLRRHT